MTSTTVVGDLLPQLGEAVEVEAGETEVLRQHRGGVAGGVGDEGDRREGRLGEFEEARGRRGRFGDARPIGQAGDAA